MRIWLLSELRNSGKKLRNWSSLGCPGSGVSRSQAVQVWKVGVGKAGAGIHQGRFAARPGAGAGGWGSCSGVSTLGWGGPWRNSWAGQLGLRRHPQDVVHAEGRRQLAAFLLLHIHWDVMVGIHIGGVVRARWQRHSRHENFVKGNFFEVYFKTILLCDLMVVESKTIWLKLWFFLGWRRKITIWEETSARALSSSLALRVCRTPPSFIARALEISERAGARRLPATENKISFSPSFACRRLRLLWTEKISKICF